MLPEASPQPCPLHLWGFRTCPLHSLVPTGLQPRPVTQDPGLGLPQHHVAPRDCQREVAAVYPMRVELEGGQGPGTRGLCSPRPNVLHLVRLRRGGWGCRSRVGRGQTLGRMPWGWGSAAGRGARRRVLGRRCHLSLLRLEGPSLGPLPTSGCGQQGQEAAGAGAAGATGASRAAGAQHVLVASVLC